jgi:uncharacterized damage-inducible protein DinB
MTKRVILLEALASTPADIERLVCSLDETAAIWRPERGGRSCHDVVSHLRAMEPLYLARLERVATEHEPILTALHETTPGIDDGTTWPSALDIAQVAGQFRAAREATLAFLQALSPAAWQRAAIHERRGKTTLRFLVQDLVNHDIEHTNQLVEIQQMRRRAQKRPAGASLPGGAGGAGRA